jgi:hypothetical protein
MCLLQYDGGVVRQRCLRWRFDSCGQSTVPIPPVGGLSGPTLSPQDSVYNRFLIP